MEYIQWNIVWLIFHVRASRFKFRYRWNTGLTAISRRFYCAWVICVSTNRSFTRSPTVCMKNVVTRALWPLCADPGIMLRSNRLPFTGVSKPWTSETNIIIQILKMNHLIIPSSHKMVCARGTASNAWFHKFLISAHICWNPLFMW